MRWLFHFGEFSVSKRLLVEARQRCRGFFIADDSRDGDKPRQGVAANTLNLLRGGIAPLNT